MTDTTTVTFPPAANRAVTYLAYAFAVLSAIISCVSLWAHMQMGLNNDHLVLMDEVRKLVAGGIPYVDYTDVSPPLIHILYIIPFLISKISGIALYISLYGCTSALIIASIVLSDLIVQHSSMSRNGRFIVIGSLAVALLGASFIHQVFGDRDHLVMVLAAPWFALYSPLARRESIPANLRNTAALMGAVAFAIKPYFYVFYVTTTAFAMTQRPWRQVLREREQHIVWGFALAYLIVIFAYFPAYPFTILPTGLQTYGAIAWEWSSKWNTIKSELMGGYAMLALSATLAMLCTFPQFFDLTMAYLYALLVGALASYGLNYGWYYTQYPFIAIALVLGVIATCKLLAAFSQMMQGFMRALCQIAVIAIAAMQLYTVFWVPIAQRANGDISLWQERGHTLVTMEMHPKAAWRMEQHFNQHPRFIFFTLDLWSINLLKEGTPRENVGRFDIMWPLPGILALQEKVDKQTSAYTLSHWLTESVAADIERHKPDMILNDVSLLKRNLPWAYNMMDFFNSSSRFKEAMTSYALVERFDFCTQAQPFACAFEVYYRK